MSPIADIQVQPSVSFLCPLAAPYHWTPPHRSADKPPLISTDPYSPHISSHHFSFPSELVSPPPPNSQEYYINRWFRHSCLPISSPYHMSSSLHAIIKLIRNLRTSNWMALMLALRRLKAIGYVRALSTLLGALIVAVSSVIKIPQIKKIVAPPSVAQRVVLARGVPQSSVRLEALTQLIHVTFNQRNRKPFVLYGESMLLGLQNTVLLLLLEYYKSLRENEAHSEDERALAARRSLFRSAAAVVGAAVVVNKLLPSKVVRMMQILCIPLAIAAKISQIRRNAELKSTAHLSLVTISANLVGSLIRVFTTASTFRRGQTSDAVLLSGYMTSFGLNAVLMAQIAKYSQTG